jgi:hypothetical protein
MGKGCVEPVSRAFLLQVYGIRWGVMPPVDNGAIPNLSLFPEYLLFELLSLIPFRHGDVPYLEW